MEMPQVCVVLSGHTVDEMLKDAALAMAAGADLVEVRLDNLWVREVEIDDSEDEAEAKRRARKEKKCLRRCHHLPAHNTTAGGDLFLFTAAT